MRQDVAIDNYSGHRGTRRFELGVLDGLESAYDAFGARFGVRPQRPISVYVYDPQRFDAEFSGLFRFQAAGFFRGVICVRGGTRIDASLLHVLHHEFVHAALDQAAPASFSVPGWLNEGLAEWFAHRSLGKRGLSGAEWSYLARVARAGRLPSLHQLGAQSFSSLGAGGAGAAYLTSYAAVDHLMRRFGERRFAAFLADCLRSRQVPRSLRRHYRLELTDVDDALRAQLTD